MTRNIFIGGAWPYANGSLHIGHIGSLLPGDILARYFRLKGDNVLYVSGSDCHGTPIAVRAELNNTTPREVASEFHKEFVDTFNKLGFSYDLYGATMDEWHYAFVQDAFLKLYAKDLLQPVTENQLYCSSCKRFLADRYVEGTCPKCHTEGARGDQCDHCGSILSPTELIDVQCKICGSTPEEKTTENYQFLLSHFQQVIEDLVANSPHWRENATKLTGRYLNEGLQDRVVTRDLSWGIPVPLPEAKGKSIYVWMEAVLGYLSASKEWGKEHGENWEKFWNQPDFVYYVHGKDNIPFHTTFIPALTTGLGYTSMPTHIVSSEYLTLEGQKLSTSRNWAVWLPDYLENFDADPLRFYLIINGPENKDIDFSWSEFVQKNNSGLLGDFANFAHRCLAFQGKKYGTEVPEHHGELATEDQQILDKVHSLFETVGQNIEDAHFKKGLSTLFDVIQGANKWINDRAPWSQEEEKEAKNILYVANQLIANFAILASPFLPFVSQELSEIMRLPEISWNPITLPAGHQLNPSRPLVKRLDLEIVKVEQEKLHQQLEK